MRHAPLVPVLLGLAALAGATPAPPPDARSPRLLVVVVADAFRSDYLDRFGPLLSDEGLGRLRDEGAVYARARVTHTAATDAPGYAAIATGVLPGRAGIPADHWFERETRKHRGVVQDTSAFAVGSDEEVGFANPSPRHLERPTLGELLAARDEASLTVAIAFDDDAALLLGGRRSDGSYWIDPRTGTWVTSSALRAELPEWMVDLNADGDGAVHVYRGEVWERPFDEATGERYAGPDDAPAEPPIAGLPTFPYPIPAHATTRGKIRKVVDGTPYGDRVVLDAVLAALEHEPLGRDDVTDVLAVGFGALGRCGRLFGPDSQEVMALVLALDARLAELFAALDARVGAGRWTLAFTSPSGLAPHPDAVGGRSLRTLDIVPPLELGLREAFPDPPVRDEQQWVVGLSEPWVYLSPERTRRAGVTMDEVAEEAARRLAAIGGIERAVTRVRLRAAEAEPFATWARDLHEERSGDVLFLVEEHAVVNAGVGTSAGSPHAYDRLVPLVLLGTGIAPGVRDGAATLLDVAPTLASLAGVTIEDADGRVLEEALEAR